MIHLLEPETIDQIAAGEVIERPASIVKELMENSIDADAGGITVEIKDGGTSFIRVTDDGTGINKNDVKKAFLRHATSKISSSRDLTHISTLGFRGEALSSIASIAKVEIITRTSDDITGIRYVTDGGKETSYEEVGCPEGTTIIVRDVFFNTPARRKFLKSDTSEGRAISDVISHFLMSHPAIRMNFIADKRTKFQTSSDPTMRSTIYNRYGKELANALIDISATGDAMTLSGYITKPDASRGNKSHMFTYINGRYVKDATLDSAIMNGYRGFLMNHRFPFTALCLQIEPELIDVNVHPAKLEVRFQKPKEVYDLISDAISSALHESMLIPDESILTGKEIKELKKVTAPTWDRADTIEPYEKETDKHIQSSIKDIYKDKSYKDLSDKSYEATEDSAYEAPDGKANVDEPILRQDSAYLSGNDKEQVTYYTEDVSRDKSETFDIFTDIRIIGQVFGTYWMVEHDDKLLIIDQHAAHEKVLYEKLVRRMKEKKGLTQKLAAPIVISLSGVEKKAYEDNTEAFSSIGFDVEAFGDKEYIITGIPADFLNIDAKEVWIEILDSLMDDYKGKKPEQILDHIATMACKAAVKGNTVLSVTEAKALIEQMLALDEPYHCPHGRPTTISLSRAEFDKKFKRIL